MAYSALPTKISGDILTLSNYDAVKGNFEAGVPDIFTTKGDVAVATAADAAARLAVGADDATLVPDASTSTGLAWQIQPAARVYNSVGITIGSATTWTTLTFDSEGAAGGYDTDGAHSTVTNTGRLTVPTGGAGIYLIGANLSEDTSVYSVGHRSQFRILLNGVTVIARRHSHTDFADAEDSHFQIATVYPLNAADFVEVQFWASSITDGTVTIQANPNYSPYFWFQWLRRQ